MPFVKFWNLAPDTEDDSILNMYVYGEIKSSRSFFGGSDNVVTSQFVEDLQQYPGVETINVYINSPGGSVYAAAAIRNQLRKHKAAVHTWCDGICASAAVGILMAADPGCRHMSSSTLLMIHNPSSEVRGTEKDFRDAADLLGKVKQTLLNIYVEGTGLDAQKLSDMMDAVTYLDATEAKELNFIDQITEDPVVYDLAEDGSLICNGQVMDVAAVADMAGLKEHLMKLANGAFQNNKEGGSTFMTLEEYLNNLPEDQRESVTALVTAAVQAQTEAAVAAAIAEIQSNLDQANTTITDLQAQLEAANTPTEPTGAEALLATMPQEIQDMVAQARADAIEAQNQLVHAREEAAFNAFRETFAEFDNLPLTDAHLHAMQNLSNNAPEMYAELRELLKVANNAMGAGFKPTGSDAGDELGGSAYDQIETAITAYQKDHPGTDYNDAMRAVLREKPALYDAYRDSMTPVSES